MLVKHNQKELIVRKDLFKSASVMVYSINAGLFCLATSVSQVSLVNSPVGDKPFICWKDAIAFNVFLPLMPSIAPGEACALLSIT